MTISTNAEQYFLGPTEMHARCRALDWSKTPLGAFEGWCPSLRVVAKLVLDHPFANVLLWGAELVQVYNDKYRTLMGMKHPAGLGQRTRECWPEAWHINAALYERVWRGESISFEDALYPITRSGALEDAWFTFSCSPVRDESDDIVGVLVTVFETTERRRARMALRANDANYRALFDATEQGFARCELVRDEDGKALDHRLLELNQAFERLTGATAEKARGLLARDVFPALEPFWTEAFQRIVRGGVPEKIEHAYAALDRWFEVLVIPGPGDQFIEIYEDVTARKQAERALKASEERFRTISDLAPALLWQASPDGLRVSLINSRWSEYTGQSVEQTQLGGWLAAVHPEDQPHSARVFAHAFEAGEPLELEQRIQRSDGTYRWFLVRQQPVCGVDGKVIEWFGAAIDIHDRKLAEATLRANEVRQAFLLRLSDALRPLVDVTQIQVEACRQLGEHFDVDHSYYIDFVLPEDRAVVRYDRAARGASSFVAHHPIVGFKSMMQRLERGYPVVVSDVRASSDFDEHDRGALAAVQAVRLAAIPLMKDGVLRGALAMADQEARGWGESEIELLREAAERTWAALERGNLARWSIPARKRGALPASRPPFR